VKILGPPSLWYVVEKILENRVNDIMPDTSSHSAWFGVEGSQGTENQNSENWMWILCIVSLHHFDTISACDRRI